MVLFVLLPAAGVDVRWSILLVAGIRLDSSAGGWEPHELLFPNLPSG